MPDWRDRLLADMRRDARHRSILWSVALLAALGLALWGASCLFGADASQIVGLSK